MVPMLQSFQNSEFLPAAECCCPGTHLLSVLRTSPDSSRKRCCSTVPQARLLRMADLIRQQFLQIPGRSFLDSEDANDAWPSAGDPARMRPGFPEEAPSCSLDDPSDGVPDCPLDAGPDDSPDFIPEEFPEDPLLLFPCPPSSVFSPVRSPWLSVPALPALCPIGSSTSGITGYSTHSSSKISLMRSPPFCSQRNASVYGRHASSRLWR